MSMPSHENKNKNINDMQPGTQNDDSSDYGSDFTPDEEELLNELLARVVATTEEVTPTTSSPAQQQPQQIIKESSHDIQPLVVTDIEDYEIPHSVRFPRVLGREAWSPAAKRVWKQQQPLLQQQQQQINNNRSPVSNSWTGYPSSSNRARLPISGMPPCRLPSPLVL